MSISSRIKGSVAGGASKRLLAVGVIGFVVVGVVLFLSPSSEAVNPSVVRPAPLNEETVQGRLPVTPAMDGELSIADQDRIDRAIEGGGSAIPTIRVGDSSRLDLSLADERDELVIPERPAPPSIDLPIITPPVNAVAARPLAATPPRPQVEVNPHVEGVRSAFEALQAPAYQAATVTYLSDQAAASQGAGTGAAPSPRPFASRTSAGAATATSTRRGPGPGEILYARMITEASSDAPGPVVAEILQGPHSGSRLIGSFSSTRDKLVLQFSTMTVQTEVFGERRSDTIPIQAFAVDAQNVGAGVASSVDYHLLENVGFTLASSFAQGFGRAVSQAGSSVVSSGGGLVISNPGLTAEEQLYVAGGDAIGAAGQSLNQLFGNRAPTVKVASGAPIGVLFLPQGSSR